MSSIPQRTGSNPVNVKTFDPQARLRYRRMGRTLRLTDQLLSADIDSLSIVDIDETGRGAPAWTSADGARITINASKMPRLETRRQVAVWLGTNAHELFHNLYTPRTDSPLMRRVHAAERSYAPGIHRSWNVLEDQRIERLGLTRYAAWRGYLVAALAHHIPVTHPESWVLVAGRTWLASDARAIARASFVATNGESNAQRCAELIGAYQRMWDPGYDDADEAWALLNDFHERFGESIPPKGGCGGNTIEAGEPELGDDGDQSYPSADEADEDEDEGDDGDGSGGESDDDEFDDDESEGDGSEGGKPGDGDGDDRSDADGDGDNDGDESDEGSGSDGDGDDDGEGDFDGESDESDAGDEGESEKGDGDEAGDGVSGESDGEGIDVDPRTMDEAIADAVDEALGEDETATDLDRVVDSLANGVSGRGDLPRTEGTWIEATDVARRLSRGVSAVLADIRDDCEASWIRRTDTGRFSVERWATEDWTPDDVFDQFDAGAMDATSLEVVLVLDISGSMSSSIHRLVEATWAIRHAVDHVEGTCTVVAFGDDASTMFEASDRPDGRMLLPRLEGSTNPDEAIREAHRIVADSRATNRIVIILTDGSWWSPAGAKAAMSAIRETGAITSLIGLGADTRKHIEPMSAFADVVRVIGESTELVPIFKDLAEQSMRAAANR